MMLVYAFLGAILVCLAHADILPTYPGPGTYFYEGGQCRFDFNLDTTGKWNSFSVDLMTGSNTDMKFVTNVFRNLNGNQGPTSYTWTCPDVTPNAAIYFYQFNQAGQPPMWTTRFLIIDRWGRYTQPAYSTQANGQQIPWGIGRLG